MQLETCFLLSYIITYLFVVRLVCGQQQQALQVTISLLWFSQADIQGFLSQLEGAWEDCR